MARKSQELKSKGLDVISLSLGEPDFETPEVIKTAAKLAIDENFSHYTPVPGLLSARKAICSKFKRDNNLNFSPEQIVISTGAKQSITNICLSLINKNDEVILPAPYWVSYLDIVKLAEGNPVIVKSSINKDFKVTAKEIKEKITHKTRLIIFSSPCNPSGSVYSEKELREIADVLLDYPNIYILSDEIYEHINFTTDHFSIGSIEKIKDRVITVNGVSKGFAMTGWRVGFMGGPKWLANACNKIQGQTTSATCAISQKATEQAMKENPKITRPMKDIFLSRRDLLLKELSKINGIICNKPQGAFYLFPDVSFYYGKKDNENVIKDSESLCLYLLEKCLVALVPGSAFGNPECIRISYATSEKNLKKAVKRIKKQLEHLS
tara:strand:- start:799 stop:1938 length:1140 start_codon:yes stop_codon:yes gene_type:complete